MVELVCVRSFSQNEHGGHISNALQAVEGGMGWDGMRDGNFFSIPGWDDPGIGIKIFFHPGIGRDRDRISRDDPGIGIEKSRGMVPFGTLIVK